MSNWHTIYPGQEAEKGQGEAIAKNVFNIISIKVPIINIIIGEGALGALGLELE